jgi:nucleoside-diphosphate-sugar epimerase
MEGAQNISNGGCLPMKVRKTRQLNNNRLPVVLLTGAAGFVGSHLADRLIKDGYRVIGVDNLITGSRRNIEHLDGNPSFQFIEHDVSEPLALDERVDWVMHFASPASPPKYLRWPIETMHVNSHGTYHLLELARRHSARFFLASTSEVYGDPLQHPQQEDYWGNVNPVGPRAVYDEAKRYAEAMTMAYHRQYKMSVRIIRIFNTYGPRMDPHDGRVVTNFVRQALAGEPLTVYGEGKQTRSLQYIDDLIEGICRYMKVEHPGPVNLGNPQECTVLEIAKLILKLTGSKSTIAYEPLPENDPMRRRPNISLAKELLDWQPTIDAERGLTMTIDDAVERQRELMAPTKRAAQG